jgi:hypothetical protein
VTTLRPYQVPHSEALLAALHKPGFPFAMDSSCMGTGKTHVACDIIRRSDAATLVVCPKALQPGWHEVARLHGTELDTIGYEMLRRGSTPFGTWKQMPWGGSQKYFHFHPEIEFLIFDEFQRCRGHNTLTGRLAIGARLSGVPTMALSATPAESPLHCRALGYLSGWFGYSEFFNWIQSYNCVKPLSQPWMFVDSSKRKTWEVMAEIRELMLQRGSRISIDALPPGTFPENIIEPRLYQIDNPDRMSKLYAEVQEGMEALVRRRAEDKDPNHALTQMLRARQEISLLRVPLLKSLAQDDLDQGRSVVLFSNFLFTVAELAKAFQEYDPAVITGAGGWAVDMPRRKEPVSAAVERFQKNETHVCIAQSDTGGVGLSMHDLYGRQRVSYCELHWSAMSFSQILGRIRRDGALSPAVQRIPCVKGTPEEKVYSKLVAKRKQLQALLTDADLDPWSGIKLEAGGSL